MSAQDHRAGSDRAGSDRAGSDRAGSDRAGSDRAEADSLAAWMGGGEPGGVEADELLARLRRGMFEASEAAVHLGKYRDLVAIGRGGMGVVYRAYHPKLDREVAIKVLRADATGHGPRLRREAQAMARLSHPNVVQVLEVGEHQTEAYVAMELVSGADAGTWLTAAPRSWAEVLAVYLGAGRGLAAAHAQSLVHRDFKPGNVMVGEDGRARVTDFGLAAMQVEPSTSLPQVPAWGLGTASPGTSTVTGARVGTPRYMAPEQLAGGRVDHRADQWAFAASLWEALYGRHPRLPGARPGATGRVPGAIRRVLQRALLEDPDARYPTMGVLLERIEAAASGGRRRRRFTMLLLAAGVAGVPWLGLSVDAEVHCDPDEGLAAIWGPPRRAALARGFASTGLPYASAAWSGVERHVDPWITRWSAEYREACEGTAASDDDGGEADARMLCLRSELAELEVLLEVFAEVDPEVVARAERATRDLPDPARCSAPDLDAGGLPPAARRAHGERLARVRAMARAGRYVEATRLAEQAVEALQALGSQVGARARAEARLELGSNHTRAGTMAEGEEPLQAAFYAAVELEDPILATRAALGLLNRALRLSELDQGEQWGRHASTWIARMTDLHERSVLELELVATRGELLADRGRHDEALAELVHAWALCERDDGHPLAPRLHNQVGLVRLAQGEYADATVVLERSVRLESARSGRTHPQVANALNNLGNAYWFRGDYERAEGIYQRAYEIRRDALGPEHAKTAISVMNLGVIAQVRGQTELALRRFEQAEDVLTRTLGPDHPQTALATNNAAVALSTLGDWERSNAKHEQVLEAYVARLGPEHPRVADALHNLAAGLSMTGRLDEALDLHARALATVEKAYGHGHPAYALGLHNLAVIHRRLDDFEAAELQDRQALAMYEAALGLRHPELVPVLVGLAQNAVAQGRWEDAVGVAQRALALGSSEAVMRGTAGLWLAQAHWELGHERAQVRAVVEQAERELRDAGKVGQENLEELLGWRAAHPGASDPRRGGGSGPS